MSPLLISIVAFIGVTALVGGVAIAFRDSAENRIAEGTCD
jgi:hypothetical protein